MLDLRPELATLWSVAARLRSAQGARSVMFFAARTGEGTSSMAASFALMAAEHAKRTAWLIDIDLMNNAAYQAFDTGFVGTVARPGRAYDASLGCAPIYELQPVSSGGNAKLMTAYPVTGTRLLVTRFRAERLAAGQRAYLRSEPGWWQALRRSTDWIVVDSPALDRSDEALSVASEVDGVVLVVQAETTSSEEVAEAQFAIESRGGRVIGVVLNRMRADARFAGRIAS
jgi:Mrp family chromosome partitioning ATPase